MLTLSFFFQFCIFFLKQFKDRKMIEAMQHRQQKLISCYYLSRNYRGPAFHSQDEARRCDRRHGDKRRFASTMAEGRPLPPLLIKRKRFIAPCAHRLDSPCNGGPFCRPSRFWKTSCCVLSATRKIFGILSIHYGFTFLLRNLSIILFFLNFISFPFTLKGSSKISWRKRKRAYSENGKCFFRSAEQSGVVGRDPIEIGRCSAKRLLISARQTRRVRLTIAPFPAGMHSECRKFAIKSLIH